jgi:hypothetical protein
LVNASAIQLILKRVLNTTSATPALAQLRS